MGTPITYAGHPLYLFDEAPNTVNGEGIDDPASPLPHGVWFLVKPNGNQLPWTASLSTVTLSGHRYLAVLMNTLVGCDPVPGVHPGRRLHGRVRADLAVRAVGQVAQRCAPARHRLGTQVTCRGHPLYFYSQENVNLATATAAGNGNGVGGFKLVGPQ